MCSIRFDRPFELKPTQVNICAVLIGETLQMAHLLCEPEVSSVLMSCVYVAEL